MVLNLLARFTGTSAMSFDKKTSYALSAVRKSLVSFWKPTRMEIDEICDAYMSLWASTSTEAQARAIFNSLLCIAQSTNKPYPLDWLVSEILFEAFVASSGDRQWAARVALEHAGCGPTEKALWLYNERISRVL